MIIALSYFPGDQDLAAKLSQWIAELGPNKGHTALLARDIRCHPNIDAQIKQNFSKVFDSVEVITIPDKIDGWPLAPNIAFGRVSKHIQYTSPQPWLWLEPDVVPLKAGWVAALAQEYDSEPRKPFVGDFVKVENIPPHMSGIAVYPPNITDLAGLAAIATDTAWDVYAADQIVPHMKQTHLISHKWKHPPLKDQGEVDNLLGQLGDAVLFHADKSGTLIDFLRERLYPKPAPQNAVQPILGTGNGIVCDIFIKTYPKDYEWLKYCFLAIDKFCEGFRETKVIFPTTGKDPMYGDFTLSKTKFKSLPYDEIGNDNYLSQQVFKMYADTFTDAEWICFIDSDTIFTQPVTPESYLKNGKFVWMITPIELAHPDEQNAWRRVMHKFLGRPSEFEFMRRFPFLVPAWALKAFREFCVKQHGMPLDKYIMSQPYREFSEFNCIGFYLYEYHRDKFEWFNTAEHPESEWPPLTVDQRWSHGEIPVKEWETILQPEHGDKSINNGESARLSTIDPLPKLGLQSTLGVIGIHGIKCTCQERDFPCPLHFRDNIPSLNSLLAEVAQHFTSPLGKGRILKKLKSYPVIK